MSKLIHKLEDKLGGHGGSSNGSSSGAQNGGSGAQKYAEQGGKYAQQHLQGSGGGQSGSGLESAQNKAGEMYAKHQAQSALGGGGGSSGLGGMTGGSGSGAGVGALGGAAGVAGVGGGAAAMSGRGKEDSKLGGYADEPKDAYGSSTGRSSRTDDLRHPVGSAGSKGYGGSTTDGAASGSGLPVDRDGYGVSDVPRSRGGGVTNDSKGFSSGPQSSLENRDSIPTAGGRVPGSNGGDHHYGRDAAMVGGAGAAGAGAYEYGKHGGEAETGSLGRDTSGSSRQPGMSSASTGGYGSSAEPGMRNPSSGANVSGGGYAPVGTTGSSYTNDPARDAAAHHDRYGGPVAAGGATGGMTDGMGRSGPTASSDSTHPRMSSETGSSGGYGQGGHGLTPEKKLGTAVGNAYESGYRDAMAHMAAERGE
ncbi:hypothetical protein KC332_g6506 [Hortaea werneckii]|nr:hypothetical protein KC358_g6225 [Hortaea werneckii]KAI6839639.1 hypothetical protein KC350_g5608 [Hortaea werneckii]KAI6934436.1 hypothetical protein KC348_g6497 [Hortaea werneckii]KAI6936789.1 hypothetical protein KC341_g6022 [Hortaea werneckii]KAI6972037.1 hypothetical protein KC321_g6448 [Hortaea werneckii]